MHELLGRSLDEVPPQTRKLLSLIEGFTPRFTRKELRDFTGWGATQTRVHLDRLVELEYLLLHSEGHGRYVYELQVAGTAAQSAGGLRPGGGGVAEGWRPAETRMNTAPNGVFHLETAKRTATGM
jgi:hypothetical protein